MTVKVDTIWTATLREIIETERTRVKALRTSDKVWWNSKGRSDWARESFGDDLDGEINTETLYAQQKNCNVCDKAFPLDERFLILGFGVNHEYDEELNICKSCLRKLPGRLKED